MIHDLAGSGKRVAALDDVCGILSDFGSKHLNVHAGTLHFAWDALHQSTPAWFFLLIPQAWTVSLELLFYLLAPWLVRRGNACLAILIGLSLAARVVIYQGNFPFDPWKQRFFPVEFGFFLFGIFAYRLYAALRKTAVPRHTLLTVCGLYLTSLVFYQFLPGDMNFKRT